jgi:3-oxoadipate enol-lactonase
MNNSLVHGAADYLQRTATMRDGAQLSYRLHAGNGKACFVLVHSLALDGNFWDLVVGHLLDSGDVLVYDCRGHGRSSKPAGPYTGALFADDLADLLAEIGWESAIVAGASMGGCVTLAFAAAYPKKVEGLGLIDTTAWYGPEAPAQWEDRAQKAISGGLAALVDFQKTRWISEGFLKAHPETVDSAIAVFLANDVTAYAETCRMLGNFDCRGTLPKINVPTMVLVGSEDYAAPVAMAEAMHQGIKGSTLYVIEGVRHLTPLECPEIVAAKLRDVAA